jgi:hypothetical protein
MIVVIIWLVLFLIILAPVALSKNMEEKRDN